MMKMRLFFTILLMSGISLAAVAQEGTIEAYSRENLLHKIDMQTAFAFGEFTDCEVHYLDGSVTRSPLNICAFDNSVRFIARTDTLKVSNIDLVDYILSPDRKFVFRDGMVLELLRETPEVSLAEKKRLRLDEPKMQGSYGSVPASSSAKTTSNDDYSLGDSHSYGYLVSIDYKVTYNYYLIDGKGKVTRATRKAFMDAFPEIKDMIKATAKLRKLDFEKRDDVTYLFDYCLNEIK